MVKNSNYKILFFLVLLIANTSKISAHVNGILTQSGCPELKTVNDYGVVPIDQHDEAFIRAVQHDMGMGHYAIEVRYINEHNEQLTNRHMALHAHGKHYIFISKDAFASLPVAIKRFVIGHELSHLLLRHMQIYQDYEDKIEECKTIDDVLKLISVDDQKLHSIKKLDVSYVKKFLLACMSREMEFEADASVLKKLACYDDAQSFLEEDIRQVYAQYNLTVPYEIFIKACHENDPFDDHPTPMERVLRIKEYKKLGSIPDKAFYPVHDEKKSRLHAAMLSLINTCHA